MSCNSKGVTLEECAYVYFGPKFQYESCRVILNSNFVLDFKMLLFMLKIIHR